jgi:hypothetical protein
VGAELELPPTIQEEQCAVFEVERRELLRHIAALKEEKDNSQQAFDKYRERARVSLLKTAAEQQAAENKIGVIQEQLHVSKY